MLKQTICPHCGSANRIAPGHDARTAKCGRCSSGLDLGHAIEVDDAELANHLERSDGLILLDVWAPWCGPCRAMAPNFSAAAQMLAGQARLLKLNADTSSTVRHLGVSGIPALLLFRNGRIISRRDGLLRTDTLVHWVREHLTAAVQASLS